MTRKIRARLRKIGQAVYLKSVRRFMGFERTFEKEHRGLPVQQVDAVSIYAHQPFANDLVGALGELKQKCPFGYSLVQRYVRAIVESKLNPALGAIVGVQYEKPDARGRLPISQKRYAAYLVRLAVGVRISANFIPPSPRAELSAFKTELGAMRALECEPEYFHRASNEILRREKQLREQLEKR